MMKRWLLAVLPSLPLLCCTPAQALDLGPCPASLDLPAGSRCGTYEVLENRQAGTGRKIALRVAVVPALDPARRLPDPLVLIGGGPGEAIIESGGTADPEIAVLRERREILMVDYRGTGGSSPLPCTELSGLPGVQKFLDSYLPVAELRACRERLEQAADLSQYNAETAADDLAEVAAALGYSKLNLLGYSYGTRVSLVFLRRHAALARTVTLFGVLPTDSRVPLPLAKDTERTFHDVVALCAADPACHAAFPHPEKDLKKILKRVEKAPALAQVDTGNGVVTVSLSRNGLAQSVRYLLYSAPRQALLPLALHLAAEEGDFSILAEIGYFIGEFFIEGVEALYLSVTCVEDVPFIREQDIKPATKKTFMGDFRIRSQQAGCAVWPEMSLGDDFIAPVVSDVPVLALSGEHDPTTPPDNGDQVVRHLSRGRHLVMPGAGHGTPVGMQGTECVNNLVTEFIETGAAEGLDASCLANLQRPPFVVGV